MGIQRMQNQDMDLILSSEAKPRLKWTAELHRRFVEAVTQLGGAEKATPKSLMRVMCIPGLTLYHLKSHLQKYRLGKNQQSETYTDNQQEERDYRELEIRGDHINGEIMGRPGTQIDESLQIAQALQVQMEVQKKLHEQIEVQRHLQLRIEAQGKYLQSILMKAQDTLAGYNSSSTMRTQVSESISLAETLNQNSSVSELTDTEGLSLINVGKRSVRGTDCSMDSSLTSSETSGKKDEKLKMVESEEDTHECNRNSLVLALVKIDKNGSSVGNTGSSSDRVAGRKRSRSSISDETCVDQPLTKKSTALEIKPVGQLRKLGLLKEFDLNSKYQSEMDSSLEELDLNYGVSDST